MEPFDGCLGLEEDPHRLRQAQHALQAALGGIQKLCDAVYVRHSPLQALLDLTQCRQPTARFVCRAIMKSK